MCPDAPASPPSQNMQSHLGRFRVKLKPATSTSKTAPNKTSTRSSTKTTAGSAASNTNTNIVASPPVDAETNRQSSVRGRCRHPSEEDCCKRHSDCIASLSASLRSSLRPGTSPSPAAEDADLRARLTWMETLIDQGNLLGNGQSIAIERVATGTQLSDIATTDKSSPQPSLSSHHAGSSMDGVETVATSPRSQVHLDHASVSPGPDEPPSKRARLSGSPSQTRRKDSMARSDPPPVEAPPSTRDFIDAYFQDVNRAYPFVDRKRVLAILEAKGDSICETPERDADSTFVYLVMAIGYTTLQRAGKLPANHHLKLQVNYKDILAQCLMRENIDTAQILLLLSIYSLFDPNGFTTWPIVDVLARQAIRLGLTRKQTAEHRYTPQQAERNRRLFWSIYTLDRMVAASIGMPVAMNDVNADVPLPGITVDEFASPDRLEYTSMLQVARHLIELRILEDKVLAEVHHRSHKATRGLTQADRRSIIMDLRTEIENWYSNGCLLKSTEPDDVMIHIRISWLAARYYNLLLLLYYPSHFNPVSSPLVSRAELVALAQKHVQANVVRFQQRTLPLNHVTLIRLFPVCMIFLHYALPQPASGEPFGAREEIDICADIMAAYPANWTLAHRAAAVVRQMASPLTTPVAAGGSAPFATVKSPWAVPESDRVWRHAIKVNFTELMQQVMGPGSAFLRAEHWENAAGSRTAGEQQQPQPTTPGSLFQVPPHFASGIGTIGGGTLGTGGGIASRAPLPFDDEVGAGDVDMFASGLGFMDFL